MNYWTQEAEHQDATATRCDAEAARWAALAAGAGSRFRSSYAAFWANSFTCSANAARLKAKEARAIAARFG